MANKNETTAKRSVELIIECPVCGHDFPHLPFFELDKISKDNPEKSICPRCLAKIHIVSVES